MKTDADPLTRNKMYGPWAISMTALETIFQHQVNLLCKVRPVFVILKQMLSITHGRF